MTLYFKQENFSHCRCLNCRHFARIEEFNPRQVPVDESNNECVKITITEKTEGIELLTTDFNCPICNSWNCEPEFLTNIN